MRPDALTKSFETTLLGRLKLKLYNKVTRGQDRLPYPLEQRLFLLDEYKSHFIAGQIFFDILRLYSTSSLDFSILEAPADVQKLIATLEQEPLDEALFLELRNCPPGAPGTLGILIHREDLDPGGYVYVVTLIDEAVFPDLLAGRVEIRCFQNQPDPVFGVFHQREYLNYGVDTWRSSGLLRLVVPVFSEIESRRRLPMSLDEVQKLVRESSLKPPEDPKLLALLVAAYRGRIACYRGSVPLSLVRPYDFEFCLDFPRPLVSHLARNLRDNPAATPPLVVYWKNGKFIASDDYDLYLALREVDISVAPVVVLGKLPQESAANWEKGGSELIPPPRFFAGSLDLTRSPEGTAISGTLASLYGIFFVLAELTQTARVGEAKLHEFLLNHPVALRSTGSVLLSEVGLGNQYVIDLVLQIPDVRPRTILIELERADFALFTKQGRPRAKVTHAVQQVEDWLRWWRENPSGVPSGLDHTLQPEGIVVIGRSRSLSDGDRRRLAHLNSNRLVKIITYDELLDQLGSLIRNLEAPDVP